jgi:hypothetical protein
MLRMNGAFIERKRYMDKKPSGRARLIVVRVR